MIVIGFAHRLCVVEQLLKRLEKAKQENFTVAQVDLHCRFCAIRFVLTLVCSLKVAVSRADIAKLTKFNYNITWRAGRVHKEEKDKDREKDSKDSSSRSRSPSPKPDKEKASSGSSADASSSNDEAFHYRISEDRTACTVCYAPALTGYGFFRFSHSDSCPRLILWLCGVAATIT